MGPIQTVKKLWATCTSQKVTSSIGW